MKRELNVLYNLLIVYTNYQVDISKHYEKS